MPAMMSGPMRSLSKGNRPWSSGRDNRVLFEFCVAVIVTVEMGTDHPLFIFSMDCHRRSAAHGSAVAVVIAWTRKHREARAFYRPYWLCVVPFFVPGSRANAYLASSRARFAQAISSSLALSTWG
jgi:hypothetical protein